MEMEVIFPKEKEYASKMIEVAPKVKSVSS
jgi:hypothetical protein